MTEEIYFRGVHNVTEFTRNELFVSFRQGGYQLSEASFYKKVEDMVNDGEIVRVGRNHYCLPNDKRQVYRQSTKGQQERSGAFRTYCICFWTS